MFDQIKNRQGEKLYIITIVSSNDIKPLIKVDTWEECLKTFKSVTEEVNNDNFLVQLIHKELTEVTAEASIRCNKKGWGNDYFRYITIEPLYTQAW